MKKILLSLFWLWFILSIIASFLFIDPYATAYYFIWVGICGSLLYSKRKKIKQAIDKMKIGWRLKFFLLAVVMILIEEAFVGILKPMSIGNFSSIPLAIFQTQFFNLLALGTMALGWIVLLSHYHFSLAEVMVSTGLVGAFFYEGLLGLFAQGLLTGLWAFPLLVSAHAMIYLLPYLMIEEKIKQKRSMVKWLLFLVVMVVAFIVGGLLIGSIAEKAPYLFPPE